MLSAVCPWQTGGILSAKVRRIIHNPEKILGSYLTVGMTVLDVGCGMGYFSLPMATLVGEVGTVIAADLQSEMLQGLTRKQDYQALQDRLVLHQCQTHTLMLDRWQAGVDFALLMMMLHETSEKARLVQEVYRALRFGGLCLFAEPYGHVSGTSFRESLQIFEEAGFRKRQTLRIAFCRATLLEKDGGTIDEIH